MDSVPAVCLLPIIDATSPYGVRRAIEFLGQISQLRLFPLVVAHCAARETGYNEVLQSENYTMSIIQVCHERKGGLL